jgi:hypothetical protein
MAYSIVGIVNLALGRIGVKRLAAWPETTSPQGIAAENVWQYVRDEVLGAKDWRFAKTRVALAQSVTEPLSIWSYAYTLPSDFIKLARGTTDDPAVYPNTIDDETYPWAIESLPDGTFCLLTNYDNSSYDIFINYIRREENPVRYSAAFINALAFRLAAELAIQLPESRAKFSDMMNLYEMALIKAEGFNASLDSLEDERGSDDWESAGR